MFSPIEKLLFSEKGYHDSVVGLICQRGICQRRQIDNWRWSVCRSVISAKTSDKTLLTFHTDLRRLRA
ncbi:hypothetical protein YC2023_119489 [Brassica napus]